MFQETIFDIETKHWFDETGIDKLDKLEASIVCVYKRTLDNNYRETQGQMYTFWEKDFPQMWSLFRNSDRVIGFNSIRFDVPVLMAYAPADFEKLNHFDIYAEIKRGNDGFASSLNSIAKATLGMAKIDSGENATLYWQRGDPESLGLLEKYCRADVEITKQVYDYALNHHHLKYIDRWNTPRIVNLDFSYPKAYEANIQTSLF